MILQKSHYALTSIKIYKFAMRAYKGSDSELFYSFMSPYEIYKS